MASHSTQLAKNMICLLTAVMLMVGCSYDDQSKPSPDGTDGGTNVSVENDEQPAVKHDTLELFDGNSIEGWEITNFGTERECYAENGMLVIDAGDPVSGVTSTRDDLPTNEYEISFEAKRVEGIDFFVGMTFPVADSHCSLIVGGWAGAIVGLSNIDGQDASDNETKRVMSFQDNRWYKFRLQVKPDTIRVWMDGEIIIDLETTGKEISLRNDVLITRPLGIFTFQTKAAYRNIVLTHLVADNENSSPDAK